MTIEKKLPRKHSDQAIADIRDAISNAVLTEQNNAESGLDLIHETDKNLEVLTEHIAEIELALHDKGEDFKTLNINNDRLRETIDEKNSEIEKLEEKISCLNDQVSEAHSEKHSEIATLEENIGYLEDKLEKSNFPTDSLDDENKNKILRNLHHNLSLETLETIEFSAKNSMPKGIIYKEVL